MAKQSRFLCIGGFLNGSAVKAQGDSFICVENNKKVAYHKKEAIDHLEGATVDGLKELVKTAITYTPPFSGKD